MEKLSGRKELVQGRTLGEHPKVGVAHEMAVNFKALTIRTQSNRVLGLLKPQSSR